MSSERLTSLTIQNLRGSVDKFTLSFEKGKPLTVIYGENGTGKSTICDALEFLGHGKVGSIENRGLGRLPGYWASLGKKSKDISVELKTDNSVCCAQVNKSKVFVHPPENKPKVEILRRSQILELIESSPGDRYKAIARFIDVSGIEESENNLIRLIKSLKDDRKTAIALTQQSRETIEGFYAASKVKGKEPLEWAKEELLRDASSLGQEAVALENLKDSYSALNQRAKSIKQAYEAVENAKTDFASAQQQLEQVAKSATVDSSELLGLWKTAQRFLHSHLPLEKCPLCESAENAEGLAESIDQRISQLAALNAASEAKERSEKALERAKQRFQIAKEEIGTAADKFQTISTDSTLPADTPRPPEPVPRDVKRLSQWLDNTHGLLSQWDNMKIERHKQKEFLAALKTSLKSYEENVLQQQELEALMPKLEKALKICQDERRQFTDERLAQIAEEVGKLYEKIHPQEGKDKISLELDPKQRASLGISTEFCGETDIKPQAYFSESHLDTLGLCVFLALSKLDAPEQTILVLDDVLASIDEPHVERLINLLHEEAQRFRHCIMTTHYRPWREKFRWGWVEKGQCHFVELQQWSIYRGLSQVQDISEVQRLRDLLSAEQPDLQGICAKAGFVLEAVLDFLTQRYGCSLPRSHNNRYTINALLDGINGKLKSALRVEIRSGVADDGSAVYEDKLLAPMLTEIRRVAQARNEFGAHFNMSAFAHPEQDALVFGKAVLELAETVIDPENGWPSSKKSGSYWATKGETRRMHPLQKPGK